MAKLCAGPARPTTFWPYGRYERTGVMAKNEGRKTKPLEARQAPAEVWTPESLLDALRCGEEGDKIAALKAAGILDAKGKLTKAYKNWGTKVTRTPEL